MPKQFKRLYPPKPKGPKNPKRVAKMLQNRLVTINLKMRHYINGDAYGPGKTTMPAHMAEGLASVEQHAAIVEEQFRGEKAVIIGGRSRTGATMTRQVPLETFDHEYTNGAPSQVISGANMGDTSGNKF